MGTFSDEEAAFAAREKVRKDPSQVLAVRAAADKARRAERGEASVHKGVSFSKLRGRRRKP